MAEDRYLWCRNCGAIHHATSFDRVPLFALKDGEVEEIPANDWREFMARHAGHRLEPMAATGHDYYAEGSTFDPMSVRYLEVSNGSETLLLRRSRRNIEEPFQFVPVNGRLIENGANLDIQEEAIRKEMKLHFPWTRTAPLSDEKIATFVDLFREVVSDLDPARTHMDGYVGGDENLMYCALDARVVAMLMAKCRGRFAPAELESLRRFVETHRESDDVMALVKRRAVTVEKQSEQSASRVYAPYRR
jgi:hypothetical protein